MTLSQGHDTFVWYIIKIKHGSGELQPGHGFGYVCSVTLTLMISVIGSRPWHNLWSWTIIVWNIIQIQLGSEELWLRHRFWVCLHCELSIRDMTLGQGHGTLKTVPFTVTGMSASVGVPHIVLRDITKLSYVVRSRIVRHVIFLLPTILFQVISVPDIIESDIAVHQA